MKIGTHSGTIHADDVFACAALKILFPEAEIVRSRDPAILAACDILVDVGGKHDPSSFAFDHHQEGGGGVRENGIEHSAFGLVWKRFGNEICMGSAEIARMIGKRIVAAIDANDNGQDLIKKFPHRDVDFDALMQELEQVTDKKKRGQLIECLAFVRDHVKDGPWAFKGVRPCDLPFVINDFNSTWEEEPDEQERFLQAVAFAQNLLRREIAQTRAMIAARPIVRAAVRDAEDSRVIVLERFVPWKSVLVNENKTALYVVYRGSDGLWLLECVTTSLASFEKRRPLPEAWAGKEDDAFVGVTGVADAKFCHKERFVCAARSREGALALAKLALVE